MSATYPIALFAFISISITTLAAEPLVVESDFEGASVAGVSIDQSARRISFMPGGDPVRGWPCWWYLRVKGITPGETITLALRGSTANKPGAKPLAATWAMPAQATYSIDGITWRHTEKGVHEKEEMLYILKLDAPAVYVAWGPPYTPATAAKFVREISANSAFATAEELCKSREGRVVPMLHVQQGPRTSKQRFGIWVQARQHAWESGFRQVAHGR